MGLIFRRKECPHFYLGSMRTLGIEYFWKINKSSQYIWNHKLVYQTIYIHRIHVCFIRNQALLSTYGGNRRSDKDSFREGRHICFIGHLQNFGIYIQAVDSHSCSYTNIIMLVVLSSMHFKNTNPCILATQQFTGWICFFSLFKFPSCLPLWHCFK